MLDHLGEKQAADAIVQAIEDVVLEGPRTRDIGGSARTSDVGKAIAQVVAHRRTSVAADVARQS
jgi:tartrate dehydrogenase/decarboxylase/D-malate dehydrogenase